MWWHHTLETRSNNVALPLKIHKTQLRIFLLVIVVILCFVTMLLLA
jgi:hypothetical protein